MRFMRHIHHVILLCRGTNPLNNIVIALTTRKEITKASRYVNKTTWYMPGFWFLCVVRAIKLEFGIPNLPRDDFMDAYTLAPLVRDIAIPYTRCHEGTEIESPLQSVGFHILIWEACLEETGRYVTKENSIIMVRQIISVLNLPFTNRKGEFSNWQNHYIYWDSR